MKGASVTVTVAVAGIYAWWASGVAPFTTVSYVALGVPVAVMIASYSFFGGLLPRRAATTRYYRRRAEGTSMGTARPWMVIMAAALILESIGLVLGGRSASVPTLSTTVDHLLAHRSERWVLYVAWLVVGGWPVLRLRQRRECEVA